VKRNIAALCLLVLAVALAACGGSDDSSTVSATAKKSAAAGDEQGAPSGDTGPAKVFRANTASETEVLFDEFGYALYRFDKDKGSTPTCYGPCAKQWPPLLTEGTPVAYAVIPSKLGTTPRKDGTIQVTYFGHPLYGFVGDQEAGSETGEFNGNGVEAFGGTWHALHRNGQDLKQ
jgi:predicted lipoprotein with Yx(FWY)xxD motif